MSDFPLYSLDDVRQRLAQRPASVNETGDLLPPVGRTRDERQSWKKAAVLIALRAHEEGASLILTRRSTRLSKHSGQIAFPGGKIDPVDKDAHAAALREADEEIGLHRGHVEIIGEQPPYFTGTGYEVTPVVAIVATEASLQINRDEVDEVFEVPFGFVMEPKNYQRIAMDIQGERRKFFAISYHDYYIWGATAGMLRALYERLYA